MKTLIKNPVTRKEATSYLLSFAVPSLIGLLYSLFDLYIIDFIATLYLFSGGVIWGTALIFLAFGKDAITMIKHKHIKSLESILELKSKGKINVHQMKMEVDKIGRFVCYIFLQGKHILEVKVDGELKIIEL
jgi:hypothetical protein